MEVDRESLGPIADKAAKPSKNVLHGTCALGVGSVLLKAPVKFRSQLRSCGKRLADRVIGDGIPEVFDELDALINRKLPELVKGLGCVFHGRIVPQRQAAGKPLRFQRCNEG